VQEDDRPREVSVPLLFSKSHDGKRANGSNNRLHPSGAACPVTTNNAAKGSMFVKLRNAGNLKNDRDEEPPEGVQHDHRPREVSAPLLFSKSHDGK